MKDGDVERQGDRDGETQCKKLCVSDDYELDLLCTCTKREIKRKMHYNDTSKNVKKHCKIYACKININDNSNIININNCHT